MEVLVSFSRLAARRLLRWIVQSPARPEDRDRMYRFHLLEIENVLKVHRGQLADATQELGLIPATYWWKYMPDLWIRFRRRDFKHLFSKTTRKITVLEMSN